MNVLDTDHVSLLQQQSRSPEARRIHARLRSTPVLKPTVTIISIEEQMRGWLALIAKTRSAARQVVPYRRLEELFKFFEKFAVMAFDEKAASKFDELRSLNLKVGSMDLKIAAMCLVNDATLLSRNERDFGRIPGLRVEDWTR